MSAPDFREALAEAARGALVARGPWRPEVLAEDVADAVLALLAERLGGDEVREAVAHALPSADLNADLLRADAAIAALRDHLGVTR